MLQFGREFCYKSFGGCELLGCGNGSQTDKIVRLVGDLCTDVDGEHPELSWAAAPYGLGYVPGPWMQSIQVSKGISSVKNGYEAITGQINVEFKKPQLPEADWVSANLLQVPRIVMKLMLMPL